MAFYGYNPSDYVMRDRTGIGAASQIASSAISSMPATINAAKKAKTDQAEAARKADEDQRKLDLYNKAAETIINDKGTLKNSLRAYRKTYGEEAQKLADQGIITETEKSLLISKIEDPTPADLKDIDSIKNYLDKSGKQVVEVDKTINEMRQKANVSGLAKEAMLGTPARPAVPGSPAMDVQDSDKPYTGEEPAFDSTRPRAVPAVEGTPERAAVPPAETREEAYRKMLTKNQGAPISVSQAEEYTNALPTEGDLEKQSLEKRKIIIDEQRVKYQKDVNDIKDAMMDWRWAKLNDTQKNTQIKEDTVKLKFISGKAKIEATATVAIDNIDKQIKNLGEQVDALGRPVPVDTKKIEELEIQKNIIKQTAKEDIAAIEKERKMVGAMSGETRTLKETPTTRPRTPAITVKDTALGEVTPPSSQRNTSSQKEQTIRSTMAAKKKPDGSPLYDQATIEAYIQEKRRKGQL